MITSSVARERAARLRAKAAELDAEAAALEAYAEELDRRAGAPAESEDDVRVLLRRVQESGVSLRKLAPQVGLSGPMLSMIATGRRSPSPGLQAALLRMLKKSR